MPKFISIDVPSAAGTYTYISVGGVDNAGTVVGTYGSSDGEGDSTFYGFAAAPGSGDGVPFNWSTASNTEMVGITPDGELFGDYTDLANHQHGFIDKNGVTSNFDILLSTSTTISGVTDSGLVYGSFVDFTNSSEGFVDNNGSYSFINVAGAIGTSVAGVNASGTIVGGYADASYQVHGFVDAGGTISTIDVSGGADTSIVGINDAGTIVGTYEDASNTQRGFVDVNGVITTLNLPGNVGISAINNAGEIVGYYTDGSGNVHGFTDINGTLATADVAGAIDTDILGVTPSGELFGYYNDTANQQHGFVGTLTETPPVVIASSVSATHNQIIAAASLFSATDADGDAITAYQFWDSTGGTGHWVVGGVAQPTGQAIDVTPAELATATFQSGSGSDHLWVRAFDGTEWGAWQDFYVNAPLDHPPVVTAADVMASKGQIIAAPSLFTASDADGDPITAYQFWDSTGGTGHWVVGGVIQSTGQAIDVTPAELATATFQSGSGSDHLWVRAFDGTSWGDWTGFFVNAPVDHAPVVTAADYMASHDQNIAATSLFSATDPDSDPITAYQVWDSTSDPASGSWTIGGVAQPAGQAIDVTPAKLASATFQSGSGSDHLWVRASDGTLWSDWVSFNVNAPLDHAPVVSGTDASLAFNTTVAVSSLFNATDSDGDAIKTYELWDSVNPASNGHILLGNAIQPSGQGIFVDASQFGQASFAAATSPATDKIWERAFDGTMWSDWTAVNVTSHA
jgi:hypothetical protein